MASYFPMFVNLENKQIQVFGGGTIAARRTKILLEFGAKVKVTAPEISEELKSLAQAQENLRLEYRRYRSGELREDSTDIVIAATDQEQVNDMIFRECTHKDIPVNVASDKEKCDFYFPGIVQQGDITVGVTAGGKDHRKAAKVTEQIRKLLTMS